MTTLVSGGGYVSPGGDKQPFPRSSVSLSAYGGNVGLIGGRTVSYGHLYRSQLWVAVAANKMSRQISRLPLKAYKRTEQGRERVRDGGLAKVLETPWQRGAPFDLKMAIALPLVVHGNAALRKVRKVVGGPPIGLMPLAWPRLRVHGDENGPVEMWETNQPGHPRFIDPDDVVHVAYRGLDGPIGISPLAHLAVTIAIEDAATRFQQALWKHSARPPSAIEADKEFLGLIPEERQTMLANLREDVDLIYGGPDNAGRPALLPPGLKWNAIGHSAQEAELILQRKLSREEVGACYDCPPPMLHLLDRATFNNITELHSMFYVTVLGAPLTLIVEQAYSQLVQPEPAFAEAVDYFEFDLAEVMKGDLLKRSQALALQISHGVLTIDEAREIENRTRFGLPETSRPLYPANNLRPAGSSQATTQPEPTDDQVQDAAKALALMAEPDIAQLLAASSGSVVEAIYALAGISSNGSRDDPDDASDDAE